MVPTCSGTGACSIHCNRHCSVGAIGRVMRMPLREDFTSFELIVGLGGGGHSVLLSKVNATAAHARGPQSC
jgi:hypothetical protein